MWLPRQQEEVWWNVNAGKIEGALMQLTRLRAAATVEAMAAGRGLVRSINVGKRREALPSKGNQRGLLQMLNTTKA